MFVVAVVVTESMFGLLEVGFVGGGSLVAGFELFDVGFVLVFAVVVAVVAVLVTGDGFLLLSSSFDLFES